MTRLLTVPLPASSPSMAGKSLPLLSLALKLTTNAYTGHSAPTSYQQGLKVNAVMLPVLLQVTTEPGGCKVHSDLPGHLASILTRVHKTKGE